jgi:hypothetical protein
MDTWALPQSLTRSLVQHFMGRQVMVDRITNVGLTLTKSGIVTAVVAGGFRMRCERTARLQTAAAKPIPT